MQFSFLFEFFDLEKFPKVDWMILYQDSDKYATRIEEAQPRKIQQCGCCGKATQEKTGTLKTGGKNYYRYYSYLCERCYNNASEIIEIWKEMGEPHTKKRLQKIHEAITNSPQHALVISRVGDEGVSLAKIERIIEFGFLFGLRRQEMQRLGRLFHSDYEGEQDEYARYKKRLYAIYEKGFEIKIHA